MSITSSILAVVGCALLAEGLHPWPDMSHLEIVTLLGAGVFGIWYATVRELKPK